MSTCYEGVIKIEEMEPREEYHEAVVEVTGPARDPFKRFMKGLMQEERDQKRLVRKLERKVQILERKVQILKAERDTLIDVMELSGLSVRITREAAR